VPDGGSRIEGLTWLITNLTLQKENVEFSKEQPSMELTKAFDDAISICTGVPPRKAMLT